MSDPKYFLDDFTKHEVLTADELLACATGPATASGFRRALMLLLRAHFASAANYGPWYQHLACYTWAPGHAGTLEVDFAPRVTNDQRTEDVPSVLVGFGKVDLSRMVVGDVHHLSDDMAAKVLIKDAGIALNVLITAKNPADAYDMAEMIASMILALAVPMMMNMGARAIDVTGWGEPEKEMPSPNRYYTVAMNVQIVYNFLARLMEESHRVRQLINLVDKT